MSGARHWEQDKEATVYIGNLDERVTDSLIWELMIQSGRIVNVHLPKDRVTQTHQGYGFVEFISEEDAEYAAKIMNQVRLFGKPIRVNKASADKQKPIEVGAELFIGNLDPMVTEQTLFDTFSRFGGLVTVPKIARDDSSLSKGYGFVSFSNFESSDEAITNLNGQFLMNKEISVQYAYKKDGKGERHGDQAERMLAAEAKKHFLQPARPSVTPHSFSNAATQQPAATPDNSSYRGPNPMASGNHLSSNLPGSQSIGNFSGLPSQLQRTGSHSQGLPTPPSGLPARPPPSQATPGYGGPQNMLPPGFQNAQYSAYATPGPPNVLSGFQPAQSMRNQ